MSASQRDTVEDFQSSWELMYHHLLSTGMLMRIALLTIEIVQIFECKDKVNMQVVVSILIANNSSKVPARILRS
jgi:hypothetical protein